jgi:hypothetical protein
MVTSSRLRALATARGVELRPDVDVIVTSGNTLDKFVDIAEELGLVILGLDGFRMDGAVVVPLMDFIADFSSIVGSWTTRVHTSASVTREVSRDWVPLPDLIEVTLAGLDE